MRRDDSDENRMILLFTSPDWVLINHLRNLLSAEGIDANIRRPYLAGALGELPFTETWPQLWLRDARDLERARAIIARPAQPAASNWRCFCGERLEGQFTACWRCGRERGESDDR